VKPRVASEVFGKTEFTRWRDVAAEQYPTAVIFKLHAQELRVKLRAASVS